MTNEAQRNDASDSIDLLAGGFLPMDSAPKDGTEIEILFRHMNWKYASEKDRDDWQQVSRAYWTDFNSGGWVWRGICGVPMCWRPLANGGEP